MTERWLSLWSASQQDTMDGWMDGKWRWKGRDETKRKGQGKRSERRWMRQKER